MTAKALSRHSSPDTRHSQTHSTPDTRHSLRVAVIGARGIGKQHAKWFHHEGCDVVAHSGISRDLVMNTTEALKSLFPFRGRGFVDAEEMLRAERPQVVVVASPHHLHLHHLRMALEHNAHVYLEKPIVWDDSKPPRLALDDARALLDLARQKERFIGINTQYVCAWEAYQQFVGTKVKLCDASSLFVEMESKSLGRNRIFDSVWVDLGSHPISLLTKLLPAGCVDEASADVRIRKGETLANFTLADKGRKIRAEIRCGNIDQGTPKRRFGVEEVIVDCGGANDEANVFRAVLGREGKQAHFKDFMHESIGRFVQAVREGKPHHIAATGEDGLRNLEIHLQLTALAKREV